MSNSESTPAPLDQDDVRKVAKLARLKLTDDQIARYTDQLGAILGYIDMLSELDTDGVEPMPHALDQTNIFREDVEQTGLDPEVALGNAPSADPPFFKVPKVLGDGGGA